MECHATTFDPFHHAHTRHCIPRFHDDTFWSTGNDGQTPFCRFDISCFDGTVGWWKNLMDELGDFRSVGVECGSRGVRGWDGWKGRWRVGKIEIVVYFEGEIGGEIVQVGECRCECFNRG